MFEKVTNAPSHDIAISAANTPLFFFMRLG
ncbi:Uncharacterised protein [Vibrio cholerae]|nr:Uncharacterised protein [Vibrio cholerae]